MLLLLTITDFEAQLLTANKARARTLLTRQLVIPGEPTLLYFEDNYASVVWYWATVIAGAIPALLPPMKAKSVTQTNLLDHVSTLLGRPPFLTSSSLDHIFSDHRDAFKITAIEHISEDDASTKSLSSLIDPGRGHEHKAATYLFTSGSTGPSKAVEFTHHQLIASSRTKAETNRMNSDKVFLSWISFDHSVSICELHLHAMYAGANQVMIPASEMVGNPAGFWNAVSYHKVAYTFSPNSFLATANAAYENDLEEQTMDQLDFSNLQVLFCGGEANKVKTLEKADAILTRHRAPNHSITPVYGLSETCSAIFYNRGAPQYDGSNDYVFASVGTMLPGNSLRLVDNDLTRVPGGEVGAIQLQGPLMFRKYYNNEAATSSCMTEDGWFDTGDTGRLDAKGNLCIVGRTKEVLIINGQNYSSFDLEYAVERAVPELTGGYTATFAVWLEDAETEDLVILFNPQDQYTDDKSALRVLVEKVATAATQFCGKRPATVVPLPKACLPKSSIGKLSRSALKRSLLAGEFDRYKVKEAAPDFASTGESSLSPELLKAIRQVLRGTNVAVNASTTLSSLGIDSLGHLRLKAAIEREYPSHESRLSLARLVACRSLADVDAYLSELLNPSDHKYNAVVELAPRGSKPTLILGPPASGEVLIWLPLVPHFPDRRILALRARGFEEGETPFESMDETVNEYFAAIKKSEPSGPYCLLGRCFGGNIAFELGKRLQAQGDEVIFCGGINGAANLSRLLKAYPSKFPILELLKYLGVIEGEEGRQMCDELGHLSNDDFEVAILERLQPALSKAGMSLQKVRRWMKIAASSYGIGYDYTPQGRIPAFDVFFMRAPEILACDDKEFYDEWMGEWNDCVVQEEGKRVPLREDRPTPSGALRFHYLPVRPENADAPSFSSTFGATLSEALRRREEEKGLGQSKKRSRRATVGDMMPSKRLVTVRS